MAFDPVTKRILRRSPELRQQFFAELKKDQHPKQIAEATEKAKNLVQSIEQQETRILGSDAYRQAFNETVKPEMRPLQPTSDLYEKGYMQEEAFWNDRHNRVAYSYGQNARMKGILRSLCDGDGTRALIESRRAEARALSEVAPKEELIINVPTTKAKEQISAKAREEARELAKKADKKLTVDNCSKEFIEPKESVANKLNSRYDKELIKTDKATKEVFYKESCQPTMEEANAEINQLTAQYKLGRMHMAHGKYYEDGKEVLKTDPRYSAVKRCVDLFTYAYPKELVV